MMGANHVTKFKAAVFDWAGATVDFGSLRLMGVFIKAMAEFGIDVTIDEARAPRDEAVTADYADLISGTVEAMADLRAQGMRIGSTTG